MRIGQDIPLEEIKHLLLENRYERILYVRDFDPSYIALEGHAVSVDKKIYVFNHNTPGSRVMCDDWGKEVVIHHNHYMTSFLDNLALMGMAYGFCYQLAPKLDALFASLARKFVAEQMFELGDSRMSRVLFLENIIAYDHLIRPVFKLREVNAGIKKSSDMFTSIASDFLLHHELGHLLFNHFGYQVFIDRAEQLAQSLQEYHDLQNKDAKSVFIEESSADVFALAAVVDVYRRYVSKGTLEMYLQFFIISLVRMDKLYAIAAELHRNNVDDSFSVKNEKELFALWNLREAVLAQLVKVTIDEFFQDVPSVPRNDNFHSIVGAEHLNVLVDTDFSEKISEEARLLAETISLGFENSIGFRSVIDATRSVRTVERRM